MPENTEQPQNLNDIIIDAIPNLAAGIAGKYYFGGIGGGLLGVAIYNVFLKPIFAPNKPKVTQIPQLP
jgi:hypothetical protein